MAHHVALQSFMLSSERAKRLNLRSCSPACVSEQPIASSARRLRTPHCAETTPSALSSSSCDAAIYRILSQRSLGIQPTEATERSDLALNALGVWLFPTVAPVQQPTVITIRIVVVPSSYFFAVFILVPMHRTRLLSQSSS